MDLVVHNAGASQHAAAEETAPDVAAALLRLNLEGPLALAGAVLPRMVAQQRGQHVVVSSMAGEERQREGDSGLGCVPGKAREQTSATN